MHDPPRTTGFYRSRLPHWEVDDGQYFITVRLAGSLPGDVAQQLRQMADEAAEGPPTRRLVLQRRIFAHMERWLDRCHSPRYLDVKDVAETVMEAIAHREQTGIWRVAAYVIMPNHLHLFVELAKDSLYPTMVSFKRWTGGQAKKLLGMPDGRFWHREWFDHWSRTPQEDERIVEYIRNNPVKAGLVKHYRDWPYALWASNVQEDGGK